MSKKPDNLCKKCHNPVLCDAPHNFVCENPTWIEDLLNDPALWKSIDDDAFPEPISHELLRLRSIFEQRQVFAMVFQIKDVGEVLMKFPVLCSAAYLKNDVITKKMIEKPLSLGDWQGIASELLKHSQHQYVYTLPDSLRTILVDILRMYQKSLFVKQRNRFIGHGALGFDDNAEYRHYCENMLSAIAKHLDRVKEAYRHLMLSIDDNNDISVTIDGETIALSPFIVRLGEELFFFDYLDGRKQPPPAYGLDYVSGGAHRRFEAPYLADVYTQLGCKFDTGFIVENSVSDLEAENVLASMNEAANFVDPTALSEWVQSNVVNEYMGGVHLLTMERGMGKTAFVYALESGIVELDDVKVCAYYCSHAQMRGVGNFIQGIMNSLRGILTDVVYRTLPQLRLDHENRAGNLLEVLEGYNGIYTERGEGSKLLLILDGLDEIPADQADVFEYIPKSEDMPENIYILLTARNPKREQLAPHVVEALNKLSIGFHYEVMPDSPENQATLRTYLSKQDMVKTERGFRRPTNAEIERLLELSGNTFINLTVYSKLVSAGYAIDTLPELNNEQLFSHYLSVIRSAYGEKLYNEALRVLLLISTAFENLTLQELAYLCGYPGITLQLLAFIKDFGALIKAVRSNVRGTELAIANERYREYVESNFADELRQMTVELVDRIYTESVHEYEKQAEMDHIPDGSLYLTAYIAKYVTRYANNILELKEICKGLWNRIVLFGFWRTGMQIRQLPRRNMCNTCAIQFIQNDNEAAYTLAMTYTNRAKLYVTFANYIEALADYSRAIEIVERLHRERKLPDEAVLAMVYMNRANAYVALDKKEEAFWDFSHSIDIMEHMLQEDKLIDQIGLAVIYMNRSNIYSLQEYDNALADCTRAIEIVECLRREDKLNNENNIAMFYINRAKKFASLKRYDKALADFSCVVKIMDSLRQESGYIDEAILVELYRHRADTYSSCKHYNEAVADQSRVINIWERLHRENRLIDGNVDRLVSVYLKRATMFGILGSYEEAFSDYSRALEIIKHIRQEDKPINMKTLILIYKSRAEMYCSLKRYNEAIGDFSYAIEILEYLHQEGELPDEKILSNVYTSRADVYRSLYRYDESIRDLTYAIEIFECLYKEHRLPDENDLAAVYANRAVTYDECLNRYEDAYADYSRLIEIMEFLFQKDRLANESSLASAYKYRAEICRSLKRYDEALADYNRTVEIMERLYGGGKLADILSLALVYRNRAAIHNFVNQSKKSIWDFSRSIEIIERLFQNKNLSDINELATAYVLRGVTYASLEYHEKALADYSRSIEIRECLYQKGKLSDENALAIVYGIRANAYDSLGCYKDALADYSRAVELCKRLNLEGKLPDVNYLLCCHLDKASCYGKLGNHTKEVAEYTNGIALCEKLPANKLSSVLPMLIKLYKHRATTYRDDLNEMEKAEADFARVRQLEEQNKRNS